MTIHPDLKTGLIAGAALVGLAGAFLVGGGAGYGTAYYTAPDSSSCLEALDLSDQIMDLVDERNHAVADGIDAYQANDVDGIDHATHEISEIDKQIDALGYPEVRDECREEMDR